MGIENQGAQPTGLTGRFVGALMNAMQPRIYLKYVLERLPPPGSSILDLGCGGGEFVRRLSGLNMDFNIVGIDHSVEMVNLAKKVNRNRLGEGANGVRILLGSVAEIPLSSVSVDLVTALETIQFWPDLKVSIAEVKRVLRPGGMFVIMNRYPRQGSNWWKRAQLKSDTEYIELLQSIGLEGPAVDLRYKQGWIVVTAKK